MKTIAVIDRLSDQQTAVILVETLGKEFVVKQALLPEGVNVHDYIDVEVIGDCLTILGKNEIKTKEQKERIKDKLALLRAKNKHMSRRRR